jgi:hypothetical protein
MHRWPTSPQPKCLQSPVMYMSLNLCFDASFVCWRCLPCHVHLSATTLQRYYYYSQRRMRDRFCLPPRPLSRLIKNSYAEARFTTLCFHCFRVFLLASPQTISNMTRRSWQTFFHHTYAAKYASCSPLLCLVGEGSSRQSEIFFALIGLMHHSHMANPRC